jgi:hypothetical protein
MSTHLRTSHVSLGVAVRGGAPILQPLGVGTEQMRKDWPLPAMSTGTVWTAARAAQRG